MIIFRDCIWSGSQLTDTEAHADECVLVSSRAQGGTSILGGRWCLAPKFASEILVGAPNFASKNIGDKYPKFCLLNFRFDPDFSQLLRLVVTELPKFFLLFGELAPNLAFKLDVRSKPPDLLIGKYPWVLEHVIIQISFSVSSNMN